MNAKILLIEDNPHILKINSEALSMRGYRVAAAKTVGEGRAMFEKEKPDLIVLDIMLPDGNGLRLCEELRGNSGVPILFLTALGQETEIIEGLKAGGDDYLPKTFGLDVLLARVEALLRRAGRIPKTIEKENLTIKISSSEVFVNGEAIRLSQNEFSLLLLLAQNEERPMNGAFLYEQVWGQHMTEDSAALRNTVYKLRKALKNTEYTIVNTRGEGYCFEKR